MASMTFQLPLPSKLYIWEWTSCWTPTSASRTRRKQWWPCGCSSSPPGCSTPRRHAAGVSSISPVRTAQHTSSHCCWRRPTKWLEDTSGWLWIFCHHFKIEILPSLRVAILTTALITLLVNYVSKKWLFVQTKYSRKFSWLWATYLLSEIAK